MERSDITSQEKLIIDLAMSYNLEIFKPTYFELAQVLQIYFENSLLIWNCKIDCQKIMHYKRSTMQLFSADTTMFYKKNV